jgi:hypothetical protein
MRKLTFLLSLAFTIALPTHAASPGKSQSYFTYDDGGTIVRQGDDQQEVDARVNFPVYPGDEVITNRRGRAEIRLADGNVLALDRSTSIRIKSVLDSYDGDSSQTIVELRYGHVAVQRTEYAHEMLRLDTDSASYAASESAVYAIDDDGRGRDRVSVLTGSIEVRTPTRSATISEGEEGQVDEQGLYSTVTQSRSSDEFERWFLNRTSRYDTASTRYLDRSLAYSDSDLSDNGQWSYVSSVGTWGWRPYVSAGWRPYYHGYWGYRGGALVWISYEPWGWVPYHYGRWSYDTGFGWVWLPGYAYSPAWVYWLYGPSYIGWAPAGWYDCYRPYYGWAYRPYARYGFDFGVGFGSYGRVRLHDIDLRPWTFLNPNSIVSTRVDQAALSADNIRARLLRDPNAGLATVTGAPARFTRSEMRDPAAAVNNIIRRGNGGGTGKEGSGSAADMTPFFRRDPELSTAVRDRVARTLLPAVPIAAGPIRGPSGVPSPGTPGTIEGRTGFRRDITPSTPGAPATVDRGGINRRDPVTPDRTIPRDAGNAWRNRVERPSTPQAPAEAPRNDRNSVPDRSNGWRGRAVRGGDAPATGSERFDRTPVDRAPADRAPVDRTPVNRGSDVSRRIIDRIGGARIYRPDAPRDSAPRDSAPRESAPRDSAPRESAPPRVERSSPPPEHHSSPSHNEGKSGDSGKVKRN